MLVVRRTVYEELYSFKKQEGGMNIGDKVTRKWKPEYGEGRVIHVLGDTIVVKWLGMDRPLLNIEKLKYLKVVDENR